MDYWTLCGIFPLLFCIFVFTTFLFFPQKNLIKENEAANSNGAVPASQSSPPEDDDEAQPDGASQDGAQGDNSAMQILFPKFLI